MTRARLIFANGLFSMLVGGIAAAAVAAFVSFFPFALLIGIVFVLVSIFTYWDLQASERTLQRDREAELSNPNWVTSQK